MTSLVGMLESKAVAKISLKCVLKDQMSKWAAPPLPLSTHYTLSIMDIQINVSYTFFSHPYLHNHAHIVS